jgi:hypothetical protein
MRKTTEAGDFVTLPVHMKDALNKSLKEFSKNGFKYDILTRDEGLNQIHLVIDTTTQHAVNLGVKVGYKLKEEEVTEQFPNGFTSWVETHHEVVAFIQSVLNSTLSRDTPIEDIHEAVGTHGLYELALEWTNEWEKTHLGVDWNNRDYWTEIESWLETKNKN